MPAHTPLLRKGHTHGFPTLPFFWRKRVDENEQLRCSLVYNMLVSDDVCWTQLVFKVGVGMPVVLSMEEKREIGIAGSRLVFHFVTLGSCFLHGGGYIGRLKGQI